jgi:hypothetical protein
MEKQTAVEWLVEQLTSQMSIRIENTIIGCDLFEKAKEMEKQQIIDAYKFGIADEYVIGSEQYYNQTYNQ